MKDFTNLFVLKNYKTRSKITCSWNPSHPNYIGVTNGLGGYNSMIAKGYVDRRFEKYDVKKSLCQQYKSLKSQEQFYISVVQHGEYISKHRLLSDKEIRSLNLYYSDLILIQTQIKKFLNDNKRLITVN